MARNIQNCLTIPKTGLDSRATISSKAGAMYMCATSLCLIKDIPGIIRVLTTELRMIFTG